MVGPSSQISKFLLTILFFILIFYVFMDVQLYLRIQNFPIERNYHFETLNETKFVIGENNNVNIDDAKFNASPSSLRPQVSLSSSSSSSSSSSALSSLTVLAIPADSNALIKNSNLKKSDKTVKNLNNHNVNVNYNQQSNSASYADHTWLSCDINPLCYVTVKAILLDHTNHYLFAPMATIFDNIVGFSRSKFITANMISYFHVFVACLAGKLVASDSLGYRRLGVVLFQFRTFLDDLDGHVARMKKNIRGERSEVGTYGYYIDGLCDGLGCIALLIGIMFYLKNNPPRRGYSQLQSILPIADTKSPETGVVYKVKITTKKVARKVLCFAGQLLLSSTAWNRYIALYQDMLERNDVTATQFLRQNFIFKSNWFFSVAWIWRVFNVHSLLHCVLLSIFCDKLWDFLKMIQYSGYIILLIAICATEMHVLEAHTFIFDSLTRNNTSL